MIPIKTKVATATGPRWVHLMVALVPAALRRTCRRTAPRGAHGASPSRPRRRRSARTSSTSIRERTQDAAGRYAQAMADAESLERFNRQLEEQVQSQEEEIASIETAAGRHRDDQPRSAAADAADGRHARAVRRARRAVPARGAHGSRAELEGHHGARGRHDLREVPPDPRGLSDRARVRPHARGLRRPARHRAPTRAPSSSRSSAASR